MHNFTYIGYTLMSNEQIFIFLTQDYSLIHATTNEELYYVQELRKEVFSKKFNLSIDTLEEEGYIFNEEDAQSFIYLLKHNPSNTYVGTVRVFFINPVTPIQDLSMQRIGKVKNIDTYTKKTPLAEISRMCLKNNLPVHEKYSVLQVRTVLAYALMVMTRINFFLYPPNTIFSTMEPSLERILSRQNVFFEQIAEPVEFYGIRTPYAIERNKLLKDTETTMGAVTRYYLKLLCNNPNNFLNYIDENPYLSRSDIKLEKIHQLFSDYGENVSIELLLEEKEIETNLF